MTRVPRTSPPSALAHEDLALAVLASGAETVAADTYRLIAEAAAAGAVGDVAPAIGEFVGTAGANHTAAAAAWDDLLAAAGAPAPAAPPADFAAELTAAVGELVDAAGAAALGLRVEETLAATYLAALGVATSPDVIALAGSILPVDRQHAAVLRFVLGEYPVPDTFATADLALRADGHGSTPPGSSGPSASGTTVAIVDFAFAPRALEVGVGTSVTWRNDDQFDHSIVADDGSFESDVLTPGASFVHEFTVAGEFPYICGIHPSMTATITVV